MTTTDKLRDVREALYIAWQDRREIGETGEVFIRAIARLTALEKEREELRAAVRDLAEHITPTQREYSTMYQKHAATIASCKRGDGDE